MKKNTWSKAGIIQAMTANMHFHMTYFAKYVSIMNIKEELDVTVVMANVADDTFNYVLGARFEEQSAPQRIADILGLFKKKNLPFSWWVSERDTPKSLPSFLEEEKLSFKEEDVGMSLLLTSTSWKRKIQGLSIKQVLDLTSLKDFADILVSVGGSPQGYEKVFKQVPSSLYAKGAPLEMYVGYLENTPVVAGALVLHADVAGLYYIMTRPDHQKQGYATEMMISLLMKAKAKGYHMATLQASASGKSLYQKLGFQPECRFFEYAYTP